MDRKENRKTPLRALTRLFCLHTDIESVLLNTRRQQASSFPNTIKSSRMTRASHAAISRELPCFFPTHRERLYFISSSRSRSRKHPSSTATTNIHATLRKVGRQQCSGRKPRHRTTPRLFVLPANDDSSFIHDWKGWHVDIEPLLRWDGRSVGQSFSRQPAATCWRVYKQAASNSS